MKKYVFIILCVCSLLGIISCSATPPNTTSQTSTAVTSAPAVTVIPSATLDKPPATSNQPPSFTPSATTEPPAPSPIVTPAPEPEPCSLPVFTVSPIALNKIAEIVTLGNLNPPGHTFPTDHIYFYITRPAGNPDRPDVVDIYAPADLTVTELAASEHVNAGFMDYSIFFQPCSTLLIQYGHVTTLDPVVFGDSTDFSSWRLENEYSTGGETYRSYKKSVNILVKAGDKLGTTGGNAGQWALDFNVYDQTYNPGTPANPSRWNQTNTLHGICSLNLYAPGALRDSLIALVNRDKAAGEEFPWGKVLYDIPGTAQGIWFLEGTVNIYPEDPHLALVYSNIHPAMAAFSIGTSIPDLGGSVRLFDPTQAGYLNRAFSEITPDGNIYGFTIQGYGMIILSMPDAETLWIEAVRGGSATPESWAFTGNKVVFVR